MKEYLSLVLFALVTIVTALVYILILIAAATFISGSSDCLMLCVIVLMLLAFTIPGLIYVLSHFLK